MDVKYLDDSAIRNPKLLPAVETFGVRFNVPVIIGDTEIDYNFANNELKFEFGKYVRLMSVLPVALPALATAPAVNMQDFQCGFNPIDAEGNPVRPLTGTVSQSGGSIVDPAYVAQKRTFMTYKGVQTQLGGIVCAGVEMGRLVAKFYDALTTGGQYRFQFNFFYDARYQDINSLGEM